ncbi:MAG: alpha-hydroxy-acid oxidizing protein [Proteobacteria bacterium]|nr:alpha-hydroxy-acid oxidizing protein [Pseudomonadota bacterium]
MDKPDIEVLHELVAPAKAALSKETWDYLMGAGETETTYERNRLAIDSLAFRPRVLRDVSKVDTTTTFLGHKMRLPVILAPIGSLQDMHKDGVLGPSRAARAFGVMHMLSSVAKPGLEEVAKAVPDYPKLFQLYVRGDQAWVDERIATAVECGYAGIALTVDLDYYGRRERDLAKRYKPTARRASGGSGHGDPFQAAFSWNDIKRIRKNTRLPLILKGIATAEDAKICVEHGVDVVYVSNHGGRQLDHGLGGIEVLPEVVAAVKGSAKVVVDGGFMRGTDIVKAMILGADAVGLGRLQGLALSAGGEAMVVRTLEILETEIISVLGLLGVTSFAELDPSYVTKTAPIVRPGPFPAFPLLREGY